MSKKFNELTLNDIGKEFTLKGKVEIVRQTSGPTLMVLNDGTCNFNFKCFVKAGVRAYPEIDVDDFVNVECKISKRFDSIEGEVKSMSKLNCEEVVEFKKIINDLKFEICQTPNIDLSISSSKLEKMKPDFMKVATFIKKAIVENRPIIIRHNADCDGYSSAITLERAIKKFYEKVSNGDLGMFYLKYKRAPSKAPFYEYDDCFKDLTSWLRDHKRNNEKAPLIIITDNGSTQEDLISIKQMKMYGAQICVIDHHTPTLKENGESLITDFVDIHINPYLYGLTLIYVLEFKVLK